MSGLDAVWEQYQEAVRHERNAALDRALVQLAFLVEFLAAHSPVLLILYWAVCAPPDTT